MNWQTVKLGEVCTFLNGGTPAKSNSAFYDGDIPFITGADILGPVVKEARSFITEEAVKRSATNKVAAGTVLLVTRTGVGKVAMAGVDLCFSQDITALIPRNGNLNTAYLSRFLKAKAEHFKSRARGATIQGITRGVVEELEIPLPPLAEQQRIAARLDAADRLRALRRDALARLDALTHSLFLEMFGDPAHTPMDWPMVKLADACLKITDGTHFSPPIVESGVPYVTAKHLKKHGLDFFRAPWFISEEEHKTIYARCDPKVGDVLYIKDGATTGLAAINHYDFEFSMLSSLALIRPNTEVCLSEYLANWLNQEQVKEMMMGNMAGAAIRRLTLVKIKAIQIPLPPLSLQRRFAERLGQIERVRADMERSRLELDALFASLQSAAFENAI